MKKKYRILLLSLAVSILFTTSVNAWDLFSIPAAVPQTQRTASMHFTKGNIVAFSAEDLEKKLQLPDGELQGITITSLPNEKDGVLYCHERPVKNYDELTRSDLDALTFVSTGDASNCSFTFIPKIKENVRATINLLTTDQPNGTPKAENASFSTMQGSILQSRISAYDPENDTLQVKLSQKPQKGTITFDGLNFTYTPYYGVEGKDTFSFFVIDSAGNDSEKAVIQIEIESTANTDSYADMSGNPYAYAASKLSQYHLFKGEEIGTIRLFHPKQNIKRYEFILMLLSVQGKEKNLPACVNTGLTNDGEIALYLKPYIQKAIDEHIITENTFPMEEIITRAEAVNLVSRAAGMEKVASYHLNYDDTGEIPQWALQAYINLCAYRMIDLPDNLARPNEPLNRDFAAGLLWQLKKYSDKIH